jgi:hypothetical protein
MARSFFTGTDAELYNGTKVFDAGITASPTTYGLSAPQCAAYHTLSQNFVAAYEALQDPSTRTKGATATKNSTKILLKSMASDLTRIIEGTSTVTDQQKIDLGINVRKTPGPVGDPGTPTNFTATLRSDGALQLKWKCPNPAGADGVVYQISRSVDGGASEYLGGAGQRKFIDSTVPGGVSQISYTIQATRSAGVGVAATFVVKFGMTSGGAMTASVVEPPSAPKLAA